MRLALDATSLLGPRTGIGTFTAELLQRLAPGGSAGAGIQVVAFGVTWSGRGELRHRVPTGVRVAARPMAARPLRELWCRLDAPPVEWWTGRIDLVHGPNFVVPPARRAAEVVTVHDLTCLRFPELCTADVLSYPALLRRAVGRGAWVHTVSEAVRDEVLDAFAVPPDRVRVVPNGAPRPLAPAGLERLAAEGRRRVGAERYVLALGTLEPRKDLSRLVRAFDVVAGERPDLHLVIAGPDGWGAEAVGDAIAASGHLTRVHRLGWVPDADRDALLAGATAFAYPSLYEGFGLPPLEALAHGTPVVATRTGALPEVLGEAAAWAAPGDTESLAAALAAVVDDPDLGRRIVEEGTARLARYSWDATAAGLVQLYRDATGARGPRG